MLAFFWTLLGLFSNLVDQFMFVYLVEYQLPDKPSAISKFGLNKRSAFALLIFVGVLTMLQRIGVTLTISYLTMFGLHLGYSLFFRQGELWARLLWPAAARFTFTGLNYFLGFALTRIPGIDMQLLVGHTRERFFALCFYMVLSIASFFLLSKIKLRDRKLPSRVLLLASVLSVGGVLVGGTILELALTALDQYVGWLTAISTGGFLVMTVAWLYIVDSYAVKNSDNLNLQAELQRKESEQSQAQTLQTMYEHLQGLRHDFDNQMLGLYGYIEKKDWLGLENYFESLKIDIERDMHQTLTGLPQLDIMLSIKKLQAEKHNIKVILHYIAPTELAIRPVDLCSIVGNIIDNAIEAQVGVPETDRYMHLSFEPIEKMWHIRMENSCTGHYKRDGSDFLSSKQGVSRGIGLKRVRILTEEYGGFLVINAGSNSFCIEIYFPWKTRE